MPLDPKVIRILEGLKNMGMAPLSTLPITEVRKNVDIMAKMNTISPMPVGSVIDRVISGPLGDIPIRIYRPDGDGPFPMLVYLHGGGFIMGSLESHDPSCRGLCMGAGIMVVAVDYRLAPEYKFPAASEDCLAATRWVADHAHEIGGNATLMAVGGDSAGGNLATVTAMRIRDEGGPPLSGQLMIYPTTINNRFDLPSHLENGPKRYFISLDDMKWIQKLYLRDVSDAENPWASPLRAIDLRGLPPAFMITAEYDPLLDEGELYAKRLRDAGVTTRLKRFDGMIHGFFQMSILDQAGQAMEEACGWLREVLT